MIDALVLAEKLANLKQRLEYTKQLNNETQEKLDAIRQRTD